MKLIAHFKSEFKRRSQEENLLRIQKCLDQLTEDQVWYQHNEVTNSIGNLILHLEGNIRQYIISTLGNGVYNRKRSLEFDSTIRMKKSELFILIKETILDAIKVVNNLDSPEIEKVYSVQGFKENGVAIIVHVIEHLSYHVGQISVLTKLLNGKDLGYYAGLDLDETKD